MIDLRECTDCDGFGYSEKSQFPAISDHEYCDICNGHGKVEICICTGCKKESDDPVARDDMYGGTGAVFHNWKRSDYNGFFTGYYCNKCYDDPAKYSYRKDNYNEDALYNNEDVWGDEQW